MSKLEELRQSIDQIDQELVRLFERRMAVTREVGEYKQQVGLPVLDAAREREVLAKKLNLISNPDLQADVVQLYENIMAISRRQQRSLVLEGQENPYLTKILGDIARAEAPIENPRVVYQGEPGAYSEMAAVDFFGEDIHAVGLEQFEDVFLALKEGRADYGVVPIENSSTGAIRQVYELLGRYECYIVGENTVKVEHCLMAPHGATLDTITHVYSHEQGLFQCEPFLARHPGWVGVAHGDTAGSAQYVAQTGDITKAAICSSRAAELYGLEILARGVNYNSNNTTRFVVVSPVMELREGADKISAVLSLPDEVGSLHEVLTIFAVHGLNLVKLESRPLPGRSWEYLFFLEFDGSLADPAMDGALQELSQASAEMRVLGNFKNNL